MPTNDKIHIDTRSRFRKPILIYVRTYAHVEFLALEFNIQSSCILVENTRAPAKNG